MKLATLAMISFFLLGLSGCGARSSIEQLSVARPTNSGPTGELGSTLGSGGISATGGGHEIGGTSYTQSLNSGGASSVGGAGVTTGQTSTAAQRSHTCMHGCGPTSASYPDCRVLCWGDNSFGELGNGTTVSSSVPVAVSGTDAPSHGGRSAVAAGAFDSCAFSDSGPIHCWGDNTYGELGDGTNAGSFSPVTVSGTDDFHMYQYDLVAGLAHHCALYGGVICGYMACGCCSPQGAIQCWGDNSRGQLGNGQTVNSSLPVSVNGISDAVSIAAGSSHTCAALGDGTVQCWGDNSRSQLGDGSTTSSSVPVSVLNLTNAASTSKYYGNRCIGAGDLHTCVILNDGTLQCWGDNAYGQLGNGTTAGSLVPVPVVEITNALEVTVGPNHSCAVLTDGTVRCWGDNRYGQLGNGTTLGSLVPVAVLGISGAQRLMVDAYHSCATLNNGEAQCWGDNSAGELGNGSTMSSPVPVKVQTAWQLQL